MFCPNCGTKNEEAAQRCRQCGLELAEKKAAPKFKGTMMMGNSPFAGQQLGGAPAAGTPGAAGAAPAQPAATPSAAPAASKAAAFKGTMVGVAPPSLGASAPPAATPSTSPTAAPSAAPAAAPSAAPAANRAMLKGTMIGVAPQGFGAGKPPAAASTPAPAPAAPAPAAPSAPPPGAPQEAAAPAAAKVASKLKGTMIGVAPQGFNPAAIAAAAAKPAEPGADLGKTEPPPAPETGSYGATEAFAAVPAPAADEVNPLGGTMLGMAAPEFMKQATAQAAQVAADHAAPAPAAEPAPAQDVGYMPTQPNPAYTPPTRPTYDEPSTARDLAGPSAGGAITSAGSHGPIGKDRNPVVTLLLSYVTCGLYGIVALVQMLGELREFRQKNDISILMFFIPIINIIEILKLPEKVAQAQRLAGIQNPQVAHPVLYLLFGLYFLPADLNETWAAARRNIG